MAIQAETQARRATDEQAAESLFKKDSTQVVIMAGVVTTVSQPFAQSGIQELLGLPQFFPVVVAGVVSVLLAFYQVFSVQRVRMIEGLMLAPLVALIVFSSYAGTNQLLAKDVPPAAELSKLDAERIRNLEAQISIQKELNEQLLRAAGVAAENPQATTPHAPLTRNGTTGILDRLLALVVPSAHAQSVGVRPGAEDERRRLEARLREARQQQLALEAEQKRLAQASTRVPAQRPPLLKSW